MGDEADFLKRVLGQEIDSDELAEGIAEVVAYRQRVADGITDAMAALIETPYAEVNGKKYINVDVIAGLGAVLVNRGIQAQLKSLLLQDDASAGELKAYSEAATFLDVLHCLTLGKPVNPSD